jgi:MerR family copper efflux transcriptional regulator
MGRCIVLFREGTLRRKHYQATLRKKREEVSGEMQTIRGQSHPQGDAPQRERLTISQVARLTGINAKAIRYYESIGLLPRPRRGENQYRQYSMADVNRLTLLRRIRLLGVPLSAAKSLLIGASDATCNAVQQEVARLIDQRLVAIDQEIAELRELRAEVQSYQQQLASCQPDEHEPFRQCRDMSCLAISEETT